MSAVTDVRFAKAKDVMTKGYATLITALAKVLKDAEKTGEVSFENSALTPKTFVELLLSSADAPYLPEEDETFFSSSILCSHSFTLAPCA